jgi:hypothetical protein
MTRLAPADLTGEVFGRLTILGPASDLPGFWTARCACGRELAAPREGFTSGRITSCGRPPAGTGAVREAELTAHRPPPRW